MLTPNILDPTVISFCQFVVPGGEPRYVQHAPLTGKPVKECFSIVPEQVRTHGGKQVFGWAILHIPMVWLEAEFHTVWERPDGTVLDVTPRIEIMDRVVFLPDPARKYEGRQVQNILHPLNDSPALHRFIELTEQFFKETNMGHLANQDHFVLTPKILSIQNEMEELRMEAFRPFIELFGTPAAGGV